MECQDLNLAQHTLINKIINQETLSKWIAVGDRNQAIYGFSGALTSSFDEFMEKGNVQEMPLDICYRCPVEVVERANKVYNIMFPAPNAEQGIVQNIYEASEIKENSMVICRNTSPLFDLYFYLLSQGKACYINGSDIMANLIKFLKPYMKDTVHSASIEMNYVMADMEMKLDKEENKIKYYIFKENYSIFNKITKHMCDPLDKISDFLLRLKELFENKENAITLCTIHKSKGLENDVVYIVNESETIPSKFAKTGEQLKQEKNLKYVARTRAKKELYFLNVKTKGTENMDLELEEVEM